MGESLCVFEKVIFGPCNVVTPTAEISKENPRSRVGYPPSSLSMWAEPLAESRLGSGGQAALLVRQEPDTRFPQWQVIAVSMSPRFRRGSCGLGYLLARKNLCG